MVNRSAGRPVRGFDARQRLLEVAQAHWDEGDLAAVSSRRLAAEAGVSHTLVNYHFGSKDALIAAALSMRVAPHHVVDAARSADGHLDVPRLVQGLVSIWEHPEHGPRLIAFARSLASGGERSRALLGYLQHTVFDALVTEFGRERARIMATAIIGVIFARYVLELPAMRALSPKEVAQHLLGMLR
ncbi:MAG TPA: TetR family transcriptional regulator [Microbacterium sp.]|nr:TetR family transcriptional regulator [Microbacterium sp.]